MDRDVFALHSGFDALNWRVLKRDQYAAIGIPEYWLIDPEREWVMVGSLSVGQYAFETFRGNEIIGSPTFPELTITTAQILAA